MSSAKRGSAFDQGRPEDPFPERDEVEPVRKATAAQMATRKIKAAKGRRALGMSSGLPQTIMQPSGFNFGGGGGGDNNNSNNNNSSTGASPLNFGSQQSQSGQGTNMFGGSATNSFPPAQSTTLGNTFSSSSFPAFGGGSTNTGFNPQPPTTGFNFTTGDHNPFAASTPLATATNGSGTGSFSGSIFNTGSQSTSTPLAGFGRNSTSSAAPSGGMFGTSGAPKPVFGSDTSSAQNSAPTATAAPASSTFGSSLATTTATTTTTSAPANPFATLPPASPTTTSVFKFNSTQPASAPPKESAAATNPVFGSVQPTSTTTQDTMPASKPSLFGSATPFSLFKPKSQGDNTTTPATSNSLFNNVGATSQGSSTSTFAPAPTLFAPKKPEEGNNSLVAGSNLFAGFGGNSQIKTATTSGAGPSLFGTASNSAGTSTPAAGSLPTTGPKSESTDTCTSAPSLFKSFGPSSTATTTKSNAPAINPFSASTPGSVFGGLQSKSSMTNDTSNDKAKEQESPVPAVENTKTGSSANTPGSGAGLFAQSFQPQSSNPNPFNFTQSSPSKTTSLFSQSQPIKPQENNSQKPPSSAPFSLFNKPTPSVASTDTNSTSAEAAPQQNAIKNLSSTPSSMQQQTPTASSMPNLTGGGVAPPETSQSEDFTRIGKIHLPPNWGATLGSETDLKGLAIQIASLNREYRSKLANLPLTADWSALSQFHLKKTQEISQKIAAIRKQAAAAKGITGHESSLSVKRKATTEDGSHGDMQDASPSKKPRATEAPSTPTPKYPTLPTTTPKASPPVSNTSSLFGSVLNKSTDSTATPVGQNAEPSKKTTSQPSFSFLSNSSKPAAPQSPFQMPSAGSNGKASLFGNGGGLLSQFSNKAKSYEQLVAERKAKDKEEDYDSDEETEEQWSARWDKKEAERVAKEKEASIPAAEASSAPKPSNSGGLNLLSGFGKPANGASTSGLLGSRVSSPAPSNGGKSVFDTPETAQSPVSNPFAHLSSGPSSNDQDDDDDNYEEEKEAAVQSTPAPSTFGQSTFGQSQSRKRRVFDDTESDSGESAEDTSKRNKVDGIAKPSLADRITRDVSVAKDDDSEKENGDPSETTAQANGVQTPAKPFTFFDFGKAAGAQSAPPKQDKFAGDQTFKVGTPIKFGSAVKDTPTFQFQPATPSLADFSATPSKPPPASTFSFLNAGTSSTPGSVFSTRAPTPLSEAETSGKESAAETEDDDGEKHAQVDLSELTDEEKAENEILFHTDQALCKHQVDKTWVNYARGRLWILKNKQSGKAFVRMRLSSGNTMLNYNILPKLKTNVTGPSRKMVSAIGTKKDGKTGNIFFAVKTPEIATEFSNIYNENLPA